MSSSETTLSSSKVSGFSGSIIPLIRSEMKIYHINHLSYIIKHIILLHYHQQDQIKMKIS